MNWVKSSLLLLSVAFGSVVADDKGLQIAQERVKRDSGWHSSYAEMKMVLRNARRQKVERDIRVKALEVDGDGDKSLTIFDSPRDVKGTAFLTHSHALEADDQWIYLPALKRVKRISSRNKSGPFMASEFAFEDMGSFEIEKFSYEYLRDEDYEGDPSFVIQQIPVDEFSGYSKQIVWIDQEHYRVRKVEFYDRKNALLKTLELTEYQLYEEKYWRPHSAQMHNRQTKKSTELVIQSMSFNMGYKDNDFEQGSLRRAR